MAGADVVNIWLCFVDRLDDAVSAALPSLLDEVERRRNERFVVARPRRLHAAAHALARLAIARRIGCSPGEIRYRKTGKGKPFLVEPASTLSFNITHSGGLAACAVGEGYALGIDVEPVNRPQLTRKLLEGLLAPPEVARLEGLDGMPLQEALVALWTGKEAVVKAHGAGLSLPLASFVVPAGDGEVAMTGVPGATPAVWRLHRLHPDGRHRLALAMALSPMVPLTIEVVDATSMVSDLAAQGRAAGSA